MRMNRTFVDVSSIALMASAAHWSQFVVAPFSLVTNSLSMIVFIRMYTKRQNIITILIVLSAVDTLALSKCFDRFFLVTTGWSVGSNEWGCRCLAFVVFVCQGSSSWLSVLYTVERFISVRWPMKVKVICSRKRILTAALSLVLVQFAANAYNMALLQSPSTQNCLARQGQEALYATLVFVIHSFAGKLAPYTVIAVLNAMIIVLLIRQRSEHEQIASGGVGTDSRRHRRRQRSLTVTLVSASCYSLVVNMPMMASTLLNAVIGLPFSVASDPRQLFNVWASSVVSVWSYCGSFFFCILAGKTFRNQFFSLFGCVKREENSSSETTAFKHSGVAKGGVGVKTPLAAEKI